MELLDINEQRNVLRLKGFVSSIFWPETTENWRCKELHIPRHEVEIALCLYVVSG